MKIKAKQYAKALFLELKDKSEVDAKKVIDDFFAILVVDNCLSQLERIIFHLNDLWMKEYSLIDVEVTSARNLGATLRQEIVDYSMKLAKAKTTSITEKEDKQILGGFIIRYGDKIIDASVRNKINSFRNNLLK